MNTENDLLMRRCIELAQKGFGLVSPNPMVGAVITGGGKIIGEGYHSGFGEAHAETIAINSVTEKALLKGSTLFVNLEPCAHFGKTPPCTQVILESGIKKVVIGTLDPNPLVSGKGVQELSRAGIEVTSGVLTEECEFLNRRFFTFHRKSRPYIILKWAQTADGFIAKRDFSSKWISSEKSRSMARTWRGEEDAVMVGFNTAFYDNPSLTTRITGKKNPIRIAIDRNLEIPPSHLIFDSSAKTIIFNSRLSKTINETEYTTINFSSTPLIEILNALCKKNISSVIIEGGAKLITSFIKEDLWDEARIFYCKKVFGEGIDAPSIGIESNLRHTEERVDGDLLRIFIKKTVYS